jgi:hypothetical protein
MLINACPTAQSPTASLAIIFLHVYSAMMDLHYQLIILFVLFNAISSIAQPVKYQIRVLVVIKDTLS